ncbi:chloroplast unusual positioning protein [Musa troglodytarum]|uniref:Chloroplast unusual positioning protein n=1 Tax=Musa troglodytarum TaxID=320322 RepID=A0A9E7L555_9LILI|nr:chloroplast unusual positioning protein [Musa troglodytarum]
MRLRLQRCFRSEMQINITKLKTMNDVHASRTRWLCCPHSPWRPSSSSLPPRVLHRGLAGIHSDILGLQRGLLCVVHGGLACTHGGILCDIEPLTALFDGRILHRRSLLRGNLRRGVGLLSHVILGQGPLLGGVLSASTSPMSSPVLGRGAHSGGVEPRSTEAMDDGVSGPVEDPGAGLLGLLVPLLGGPDGLYRVLLGDGTVPADLLRRHALYRILLILFRNHSSEFLH